MPVITRIGTDREHGFYQLDVTEEDGETVTLSVHEDVLVHDRLSKGLRLTQEQFDRLRREAEGVRAYNSGLHYLSYRMRSIHEMEDYLQIKGFTAAQIAYATDRMQREGLLDDRQFAASFTRTRIRLSTKGPQMIYRELLQAGVDRQIAADTQALFPREKQLEHARKYLAKQTASVKNKKSSSEARMVLSRLLMQRGYSREISEQVIGEVEDFLSENEKNALLYQGDKAMKKYKKFSGEDFIQRVKVYLSRKGFPVDAIMSFLEEHTAR